MMELERLVQLFQERGPDSLRKDLAAKAEQSGGEIIAGERLEALLRVLDREASSLSAWNPEEEPGFALQQIRNRALECGFPDLAAEAERRLAALALPWLAELRPVDRDVPELLRTFPDAFLGSPAFFPPGDRGILIRARTGIQLRDLEDGTVLADHPGVNGEILHGPNDSLLIRSHTKKDFQIRELASGNIVTSIPGFGPQCVLYSRDGRFLAKGDGQSTGFDGEYHSSFAVELFDLSSSRVVWRESGQIDASGGLSSLVFSPDGRYLAAIGCGNLYLCRTDDGQRCGLWPSSSIDESDLAFTPDSRFLLMNDRKSIFVLELESGTLTRIDAGGNYLSAMVVFPDSTRVLGVDSATVHLWNIADGRTLWERKLASDLGPSAWIPRADGPVYVSPGRGRLEIFDQEDGKPIRGLDAHPDAVGDLAVTPDGRRLVTSGRNGIRVWDLPALLRQPAVAVDALQASDLLMTASGDHLVLVKKSAIRVLRYSENGGAPEIAWEEADVPGLSCVALSPDGAWLLCGSSDGTLRRFSLDGKIRDIFPKLLGWRMERLHWSPDGSRIAVLSDGARVLDLITADFSAGTPPAPVRVAPFDRSALDLCFSPDGRLVATAHDNGARVFDTATASPVAIFKGWADQIRITAEGFLLVAHRSFGPAVWNIATKAAVREAPLTGSHGAVFSPDGRWVVSDTERRRLGVETRQPGKAEFKPMGEISGRMDGHSTEPSGRGVVFGPGGDHVATASSDGDLYLWNLPSMRLIARLKAPLRFVRMAMSRKGSRIAAIDAKARVHLLALRRPETPETPEKRETSETLETPEARTP